MSDALGDRFAFAQTRRDAATRLGDVVRPPRDRDRFRFRDAIVLVSPHDEVRLLAERLLRDRVVRAVRDPGFREGQQRREGTAVSFESRASRPRRHGTAPVLVHEDDVEPVVRVLGGTVQVDPPIGQLEHEPVVANIAHPVQRQLRLSLLQQDWFHLQAVFERFFVVRGLAGEFHPAEIVDQAGRGQDVEGAEGAFLPGRCSRLKSVKRPPLSMAENGPSHRTDALRVVVVAVNRKDGQSDIDVFVFVIDSRPAVRVEGD